MARSRESEPLLARPDTDINDTRRTAQVNNGNPSLAARSHDNDSGTSRSPRDNRSTHHNLANLPAFQFRLLCLSIWTGTFLSALDGTIIATLLTPIGSSFNASNQTSWLGTSYLLSVCAFTPTYGRLADLAGRRAAHITALTFFTLGTILCALAPSMNTLIAARGLAGVGGGGINTVGVIIMTDLVDLRRRGMFQGYANIFFGLGAAMGGPVGGWISDTIGWRGAFWVQPPLLLAAGVGVWVNAKHTKPLPATIITKRHDNYLSISHGDTENEDHMVGNGHGNKEEEGWRSKLAQVDWAGLILLVVAVGSLLLGMSFKTSSRTLSGDEYPWSSPWIYVPLLFSALTTLLFILVEHRFAIQPILPLSLLARRTPLGVGLSNFFMTLSQFSLLYNVPLYFATVHGDSSSVAGAHLLPNSVMICFGSLAVGYVMRRTGRYWTLTLLCSGLIVLSSVRLCFWTRENTQAGGGRGWSWSWVDVMPGGFGYAGVLTTSLVGLMSDVTREGKGEQWVRNSPSDDSHVVWSKES